MSVIIQQPQGPEERFWEQTRWMRLEDKDRTISNWRQEDDLMAKDDLAGVVRLRQRRLAIKPDDLHTAVDLAEAHLMMRRGDRAVEVLGPVHWRHPEHEGVQRLILESLFMQGKMEDDFRWRQRIPVLRLGPTVVDACRIVLTDAGGLMVMGELYEELTYHGFLAFSWQKLGRFLHRLPDFRLRGAKRQQWRYWVELPDMAPGRRARRRARRQAERGSAAVPLPKISVWCVEPG